MSQDQSNSCVFICNSDWWNTRPFIKQRHCLPCHRHAGFSNIIDHHIRKLSTDQDLLPAWVNPDWDRLLEVKGSEGSFRLLGSLESRPAPRSPLRRPDRRPLGEVPELQHRASRTRPAHRTQQQRCLRQPLLRSHARMANEQIRGPREAGSPLEEGGDAKFLLS